MRKVVGGTLNSANITGLVGACIVETLVTTKIGVTGVIAALAGLICAVAAPLVAFVAIPVVLVALIAIGFYLLASNPNENRYWNQLSNSVEK